MDIVRVSEKCRVCGLDDRLDVISFGSVPLANGFLDPSARHRGEQTYPVDVVVCRECRLMSLRHVVDPEVLFRDYVYVSSSSETMARHMRRIVELCVRRAALTPDALVVELGSNIGSQLSLFRAAGMRVLGVDPARNLAEIAAGRRIETIPAFFGPAVAGPIARERGPAKLVLGRQCLAHIDDVHNVLDGVDAVLAPDGVLVIEVPYLVDLLEGNQFDTIYHEHLSYFSVGTLSRLFADHDMRLVDVERVAVHGGSIVVSAVRAASATAPRPSVAESLALEDRLALATERPYLEFAERTRRVTAAIGDLVRELAADGKRVAGYGAPSKGAALLQYCGLGAGEVEFCSDTTDLKHGKMLPGSRIPVWSPERARAFPPDYYLLLAWNYAEEITRNERRFLERGGRFIVPIPEPRVVSAESVLKGA